MFSLIVTVVKSLKSVRSSNNASELKIANRKIGQILVNRHSVIE
jgi:hypothetical protein